MHSCDISRYYCCSSARCKVNFSFCEHDKNRRNSMENILMGQFFCLFLQYEMTSLFIIYC